MITRMVIASLWEALAWLTGSFALGYGIRWWQDRHDWQAGYETGCDDTRRNASARVEAGFELTMGPDGYPRWQSQCPGTGLAFTPMLPVEVGHGWQDQMAEELSPAALAAAPAETTGIDLCAAVRDDTTPAVLARAREIMPEA